MMSRSQDQPTSQVESSDPAFTAYLDAVASSAPTPGGGSVVATVGAAAAALGQMVCRVSLEKTKDANIDRALRSAATTTADLRHQFLHLRIRDESAFAAYVAASALPRNDDEEKAARRVAVEMALVEAAAVPMAVAETCQHLLATLEIIAGLGRTKLLSDVEVALHLAEAVIHGALANVRVNLALMRDEEMRHRLASEMSQLENATAVATKRVWTILSTRQTDTAS